MDKQIKNKNFKKNVSQRSNFPSSRCLFFFFFQPNFSSGEMSRQYFENVIQNSFFNMPFVVPQPVFCPNFIFSEYINQLLFANLKETATLLQFQKVFPPNLSPEGAKKTTVEGKIIEKDLSNEESIKDIFIL